MEHPEKKRKKEQPTKLANHQQQSKPPFQASTRKKTAGGTQNKTRSRPGSSKPKQQQVKTNTRNTPHAHRWKVQQAEMQQRERILHRWNTQHVLQHGPVSLPT
ncbi:unnamed protein product [Ilex paraguariensis]|uniref:Uncharacterized protein n=1 Tax=Ilex paraguariensis TaxID=185542 RepID=A0ABC8RNQ5_9AQUA